MLPVPGAIRPQRRKSPGSFRQSILIIEKFIDVHGLEGLFHMGCAIFSNFHEAVRHAFAVCTNSFEPFANRLIHGSGQALARQLRQFADHAVSLFVLDIQAHGTILPLMSTILPYAFLACSYAVSVKVYSCWP